MTPVEARLLAKVRAERDALRARVKQLEAENKDLKRTIPLVEEVQLAEAKRDFWKARAEKAEAQVTALTSPVPGLAEDGPYTEADVDAIEAHRKKPYARLRATVRAVAAARALIEEKKR